MIYLYLFIALTIGIIIGLWIKRYDKIDGFWAGWLAAKRCYTVEKKLIITEILPQQIVYVEKTYNNEEKS